METEDDRWIVALVVTRHLDRLALVPVNTLSVKGAPGAPYTFKEHKAGNKEGFWPGLQAGLRLVARLNKPITFSDLTRDPITRNLPVVLKRFIGKTDITEDWPLIYHKIVGKNPALKRTLRAHIVE